MDKHTIITLKRNGHSNREIERITGINRKTVAKYWKEYSTQSELLNNPKKDTSEIQEKIVAPPKYNSSTRKPRKYTNEIDQRLDQILLQESKKDQLLGPHKQKLTKLQIHKILIAEGYDISYSTITVKIN